MYARALAARTAEAIDTWRRDRAPQTLQRNGLIALGATLALVAVLWLGRRLFRWLNRINEELLRKRIRDVQIREFRIVGAPQIWALLAGALALVWVVAVLAAIYLYLSGVLALFPWTRGLALELVSLLLNPLRILGTGLLDAVPNLAFLAVLFVVVRYLLRMVRRFFDGVADGRVALPDFDPEWAAPTCRLVRALLLAFSVVSARR